MKAPEGARIGRGHRKSLLRTGAFLTSLCFLFLTVSLPLSAEPVFYRFGDGEGRKIALTFDDGPHPSQTPRILSVLSRYGVRATFFMVGSNVGYYPEAAHAVAEAGHEIGNHTFLHRHLAGMNEGQLSDELRECAEAVERVCGVSPRLFRPPEGAVTPCVRKCASDAGYPVILWSIDTRDWQGRSASEIADCVLSEVRPGSIILMHDYIGVTGHTAEALERVIPVLLERGYTFVTVSELLSLG